MLRLPARGESVELTAGPLGPVVCVSTVTKTCPANGAAQGRHIDGVLAKRFDHDLAGGGHVATG